MKTLFLNGANKTELEITKKLYEEKGYKVLTKTDSISNDIINLFYCDEIITSTFEDIECEMRLNVANMLGITIKKTELADI